MFSKFLLSYRNLSTGFTASTEPIKKLFGFYTVLDGSAVVVQKTNGLVNVIEGPKKIFLINSEVQPIKQYIANQNQYLSVFYKNGKQENIQGPISLFKNPSLHETIEVAESTKLNANELLVIYKSNKRYVFRGPNVYFKQPDEWIHEFVWSGKDPRADLDDNRKIPGMIKFHRLRDMPDQFYYDVNKTTTSDNALLDIKLMIFFNLKDIDRMLDNTHDPVSELINAITSDVISFVNGCTFNVFKEQSILLNQLESYPTLLKKAESIGYHIEKIVYIGYRSPKRLTEMHNDFIEEKTKIELFKNQEDMKQQLEDFKLECETKRKEQIRIENEKDCIHKLHLKQLQMNQELKSKIEEETIKLQQLENLQKLDSKFSINEYLLREKVNKIIQIQKTNEDFIQVHHHEQ